MKVPLLDPSCLPIAILLALLLPAPPALGHGSMERPVSRVLKIFLEDPQTPDSASSRAAIAVAGTQAFYDWHEVNRLVPDYNYQRLIPDGQLASAGRAKYAGLDLLRSDWPATPVNRGAYHMIFNAHVPHDPSFFQAFISRPGWNPLQPLRWSDLEPLPGADAFRRQGNLYTFDTELPQRTGRHVIYAIWQRIDPAGEAFFSISDVDFGNGTGSGNPYAGPTVTPPIDHGSHTNLTAWFKVQNDWGTGFNGEVTVTNTTPYLWNGWQLAFSLNGQIQNIWSSHLVSRSGNRYSITNDTWNRAIQPGKSIVFGFSATPSFAQVGAPYAFQIQESPALPGTGTGTGSGTGTPPPPPPPSPVTTNTMNIGSATLGFVVDNRWDTGFTGTVRITNRGTTSIQGWTVAFDLDGTVMDQWNSVSKGVNGRTQSFGNAAWNGTIAPGATVSFGFQARASIGSMPTRFAFNGTAAGPTGGTPPPAGTVQSQLNLKVTRDWGSGFTGSATVKHLSGPSLTGWTLTFDFPHRITAIWDAVLVSRVGNRYTLRNAAWNASLKPGASVTFGFNADPGGVVTPPTNVTLK